MKVRKFQLVSETTELMSVCSQVRLTCMSDEAIAWRVNSVTWIWPHTDTWDVFPYRSDPFLVSGFKTTRNVILRVLAVCCSNTGLSFATSVLGSCTVLHKIFGLMYTKPQIYHISVSIFDSSYTLSFDWFLWACLFETYFIPVENRQI